MLRWVAYHAGALSQVSKLPDLAAFMAEKGDPSPSDAPRPRQTAEEQYRIAVAWNARLGGKVVYREGP